MKRILKILGIITILSCIAGGALAYYFYTHVKPILITEINKTLAVEVGVSDINISSIRDFPKLGVQFTEVSIDESTSHYNKKLLQANELNLFINIFRIYKGEYIIDAVTLRGADLYVADLNKGTNYDIFKPSDDKNNSPVSFEIKNLTLQDCNIQYSHLPSKFSATSYTPSSSIGLRYNGNITQLKVRSTLDSATIGTAGDKIISKKNLVISSGIEVNTESEVVLIDPSSLAIASVQLNTEGSVNFSDKPEYDINFSSKNSNTNALLSVLPKNISESLSGIDIEGKISINGYFKGKSHSNYHPSFGFEFSALNTNINIKEKGLAMTEVNAVGELSMPNIDNLKTSKATCQIEKAQSGENSLNGLITVSDFEKPQITWDGKADLSAPFVGGFGPHDKISISDGRIKLDGKCKLTYDLEYEEVSPNSFKFSGKVLANNIKAQIQEPKIEIKSLNLDISANNDKMVVNRADLKYNSTNASLKGILENYNSLFNEQSNATLVGNLDIKHLNINEFMSNVDGGSEAASSSKEILPIKLRLKTDIQDFWYNDFNAENLKGVLISDRIKVEMPKCEITALDGRVIASIGLKKWGENHLLDINSDIESVNITKLLKQFNNFEQSEITDKHLSGLLSGKILAKVILDKNYEPILPKLYAKADVTVENGALVGYEPLRELSSFVNIEDLENVQFKTLKNSIEIFDQTIFIPKMMIENNAMNLEIEGTHTFENEMRYNMGLSVAELLANKAKWIARKNDKRIEKNSKGGLTAYIIMEGTPDDLKIRYDRATVTQNAKEEVKKERVKFIKAIKGEGSLEDEEIENKDYDNVWDE
ncbi:MAG: AsmA-like C-terminal region-containing protein [Bacteroidia bacterium]